MATATFKDSIQFFIGREILPFVNFKIRILCLVFDFSHIKDWLRIESFFISHPNNVQIDKTTKAKITEDVKKALPMIKFAAC